MILKKYLLPALLTILFGATLFVAVKLASPKIAYVKTGELVNKYLGMKEARAIYKEKVAAWQSNIDTLESDYQRSVGKYNLEYHKLAAGPRKEQEILLEKQRQNIQQYVKTLDEKAKEEDNKMTDGVINQINSYVEEYGKEKDYDYILGTTQQGNILYGAKGKDITEEILNGLNESYNKGQKK